MLINVFLSNKFPYSPPPDSFTAAIQVSSESAPPDYPISLPARAFKITDVNNRPLVPIQKTELIEYQHRPELLQKETFVAIDEEKEEPEYEAYRIPMFIVSGQERIFYVVYADEGSEAVAFTSDNLLDLLRRSKRVHN